MTLLYTLYQTLKDFTGYVKLMPMALSALSSTPSSRFLLVAMMLFFVFIADAIMSYFAPVLIEGTVGSSTKMGMILATSSMAGMVTDFIFVQIFSQKKAFFFQRVLFMLVFLFPLSFFLGHGEIVFILAMAWWGISYEAMVFCTYHAIHEAVGKAYHAWAWGLVAILRSLAYTLGPLITSSTFAQSRHLPLYYAIIFNGIAVSLFFLHLVVEKKRRKNFDVIFDEQAKTPVRSLRETFQIWKTLDKVIWPLLILLTLFHLFETAIFTVGPLLSESLKAQHELGGLFMSMYSIPGIFVGFFLQRLSARWGKKKLSFIGGILGGFVAITMGSFQAISMILIEAFITAFWFSIMQPLLLAVFEDLIARGEQVANDLITMTALTSSFSFVVGPIINGYLSDRLGSVAVFQMWGGLILIWSLWLFFTFPRKTHLPQKRIIEILHMGTV
jgi:predicted MFS family arabinose efflux permease